MERDRYIKRKLKEGIEIHKKNTITNALLNKAANELYNAYRHLEMACEHCDDKNIIDKIEDIKLMLGHEIKISGDFNNGSDSSVINLLKDILDNKKNY